MSEIPETIADIIAEKRRRADEIERDCAEKMKRGEMVSDCYARELVADIRREADRMEAAHKREADSIHRAMVILAGIEMPDPDYPPKLWTALEDAYDALSDALGTDGETTADEEEAKANGRHFVIQPRGDCAKLREAVEVCLHAFQMTDWTTLGTSRRVVDLIQRCKAALAEPARNCDVGTAQEQTARFAEFCYKNKNAESCCADCPIFTKRVPRGAECELTWAQMPYESERRNEDKSIH